jgi:hypothetical protein
MRLFHDVYQLLRLHSVECDLALRMCMMNSKGRNRTCLKYFV